MQVAKERLQGGRKILQFSFALGIRYERIAAVAE